MPTLRPLSTRARLARLAASWTLVSVGVPMLVRAELGVAPFDVLNTGVSHVTGWSFGLCFIVDSMVMFALGRAFGARLGWASLVGTLAIGPLVNVVLGILPEVHQLAVRSLLLLGGIAVLAVAICLAISTDLGAGPSEVLMLGLVHQRMGVVPARWISDGSPVAIGLLLGGALGVGTAVFALAMGPLVKFGLQRLGYVPHGRVHEAVAGL